MGAGKLCEIQITEDAANRNLEANQRKEGSSDLSAIRVKRLQEYLKNYWKKRG